MARLCCVATCERDHRLDFRFQLIVGPWCRFCLCRRAAITKKLPALQLNGRPAAGTAGIASVSVGSPVAFVPPATAVIGCAASQGISLSQGISFDACVHTCVLVRLRARARARVCATSRTALLSLSRRNICDSSAAATTVRPTFIQDFPSEEHSRVTPAVVCCCVLQTTEN